MNWHSMQSAPRTGVILLRVGYTQDKEKEKRVFVAERSTGSIEDDYWMITTGWDGWGRLKEYHWTPIEWTHLPPAEDLPQGHMWVRCPKGHLGLMHQHFDHCGYCSVCAEVLVPDEAA